MEKATIKINNIDPIYNATLILSIKFQYDASLRINITFLLDYSWSKDYDLDK
jgi:hypothetical protein